MSADYYCTHEQVSRMLLNLCCALAIVIGGNGCSNLTLPNADHSAAFSQDPTRYLVNHETTPEDTLWSIARQYNPGIANRDQLRLLVEQIRSLNNLPSDLVPLRTTIQVPATTASPNTPQSSELPTTNAPEYTAPAGIGTTDEPAPPSAPADPEELLKQIEELRELIQYQAANAPPATASGHREGYAAEEHPERSVTTDLVSQESDGETRPSAEEKANLIRSFLGKKLPVP